MLLTEEKPDSGVSIFLDSRNRNYFSFLERIVSVSPKTRQDYLWVCFGVFIPSKMNHKVKEKAFKFPQNKIRIRTSQECVKFVLQPCSSCYRSRGHRIVVV